MYKIVLRGEKPDTERRGCSDCYWRQASVSWWCKNPDPDFQKKHGLQASTGGIKCPGWSPCKVWDELSPMERGLSSNMIFDSRSDDEKEQDRKSVKNTKKGFWDWFFGLLSNY